MIPQNTILLSAGLSRLYGNTLSEAKRGIDNRAVFKRSKLRPSVSLDPYLPLHNNSAMTERHLQPELLLGEADRGFIGTIKALKTGPEGSSSHHLERQLIEMGFTEGARVEILHEGAISRDPIAVRIDNVTMALRRREAMSVIVSVAAQ